MKCNNHGNKRKITMKKIKCDEKGFHKYGGKLRFEKHYFETKQKSNTKFEKRETLKKFVVISGIFGIIIGSLVIYQFVVNL